MIILLLPVRRVPQPILDQGDGAALKNFALDVEACMLMRPWATSAPMAMPVWMSAMDWATIPAIPTIDEELFLVAWSWADDRPIVLRADSDELSFIQVDEDTWSLNGHTITRPSRTPIYDADALPIAASPFGLDEDLWAIGRMAGWTVPVLPRITDDDVWPTPPVWTPISEDLWLRLTTWPILPPFPLVLDDEVLPNAANFPIEEDAYVATLAWSRSLLQQAITDTDALPPAGTPSIVEDDVWTSGATIRQTWSAARLPGDDEALAFADAPPVVIPLVPELILPASLRVYRIDAVNRIYRLKAAT